MTKEKKATLQGRGELTERIKAKSKELLGYEMDQTELRLMPYIVYVMMNHQHIHVEKVNGEERQILAKWREAGHIKGGASGLKITREFWEILCEICFLGYVDID